MILVRESNRAVGSADKLTVHRQGLLHRAFSIFLVDDQGRLLLQQRHPAKYHSGGLWANTCCGHPRPGELTRVAAARRLREELGVPADLTFRLHSRYRAALGGGMYENEFVYLYFGRIRQRPDPHPGEISAIDFLSLDALSRQCAAEPSTIAVWLRHYLVNHGQALRWAVREALLARR